MESTLKFDKTNLKLRIVFFLVGLLIMALGISIIAISNFGNGPWDAVNIGLSEKTGLSIGLCMNIVAFIQIIIGGIIRKEFPNIATMITSIFLGLLCLRAFEHSDRQRAIDMIWLVILSLNSPFIRIAFCGLFAKQFFS